MKKFVLIVVLILGMAVYTYPAGKKGQWEIGFHYSSWSIDIIGPLIENNFTPEFENYDPEKGNFNFHSVGNNYGFEVRFFPKGKNGSFSIGFSYERNNFKADIDGSYTDYDDAGNRVEAEGAGSIELLPHSFNFSFRWELWPTSRIHPYIGIGLGLGPLNGSIQLHTRATTYYNGYTVVEEADEVKTIDEALEELAEEDEEFPLDVFPIVHLQFGLRGEVIKNVYLLGEIAIYDGVIFRGGAAVRF